MSSKESNKKPSGKTDSAATAAEKSVDATNRAFEVRQGYQRRFI